MNAIDHYWTMARYNRLMNERLYAVAGKLSDEERRRDLGAFFRSVHGTLNHLLLADRAWLLHARPCSLRVPRRGGEADPPHGRIGPRVVRGLYRALPGASADGRGYRELRGRAHAGAPGHAPHLPDEQGGTLRAPALVGAEPLLQPPDPPPGPSHHSSLPTWP